MNYETHVEVGPEQSKICRPALDSKIHLIRKGMICLGFLILLATTAFTQKGVLTSEMLTSLNQVRLLDVSPDEQRALYQLTGRDPDTGRPVVDLYLIRLDGGDHGQPTRLTHDAEAESWAQFRPDGKKIGYVKEEQFWEMDADGANPQRISGRSIRQFRYAPSGRHLVYLPGQIRGPSADPDPVRSYSSWQELHDRPGSPELLLVAYHQGQLIGEPQPVLPKTESGAPLWLWGDLEEVQWSDDSQKLTFAAFDPAAPTAFKALDANVYVYELGSAANTNISKSLGGLDDRPVFSPSGRYLAWNSRARSGYAADRVRIFLYDFVSGQKWDMTAGLNMDAHQPSWASDQVVYFRSDDEGTWQLYKVDFSRKGRLRPMTNGFYDYQEYLLTSWCIAAIRCSLDEPTELFRLSHDTGKANQLTFSNKSILDSIDLGMSRYLTHRTPDRHRMRDWLIFPPDYHPDSSRRYPVVVYLAENPHQPQTQRWSDEWNPQLLAAQGYLVLAPNPRGVTSFGRDWTDPVLGDWSGAPVQDVLLALDTLRREPFVDTSRIALLGDEYGGAMAYWLLAEAPALFRTAVVSNGLFNLESWYGQTGDVALLDFELGGPYWAPAADSLYRVHSPHRQVGRWQAPMLFVHDASDPTIPEGESRQAFQAAQLRGLPSRYLLIPATSGGLAEPKVHRRVMDEVFAWLDRYLR